MRRKLITLFAVLALALAACGDDDVDVATPGAGGDDGTNQTEPLTDGEQGDDPPADDGPCIGQNEDLLPEYEGLTEEEATDLAADQGYTVRVVGVDGECFAITMDLRDDRVNLELADDVVIAAAIY